LIWTGSTNATGAAFHKNVEFMLALVGKKSVAGIDALMAADGNQVGFRSFLKDYVPSDEPFEGDAAKRELEQTLDEARLALSIAGLSIRVTQLPGSDQWKLELLREDMADLELPEGLQIRAWPISCRAETTAKPVTTKKGRDPKAVFEPLAFESLTSFVAFEIVLARESTTARVQFVLNLPAKGFPEDRAKRLLLRLLDNRDAVMRYIQLLLEAGEQTLAVDLGAFGQPAPSMGAAGNGGLPEPLLEPLVRALHRDPQRLDDVARLVDDLKAAGAGARELPAGFDDIWIPIWTARQGLKDAKRRS
jgi:hypothetical protein